MLKIISLYLVMLIALVFPSGLAASEVGRFQVSAVSADTYFVIDTKSGIVYRCDKKKCSRVKSPKFKK
jgi:hypothetical protein